MKRLLLATFTLLLLTACTIASPLTTTEQWLEALKNQQFDTAAGYMVLKTPNGFQNLTQSDIASLNTSIKKDYGRITSYAVDKTEPMNEQSLKDFNVTEGYFVYYSLQSEKLNQNLTHKTIIKVNNQWKLVKE